MLGHLEDLWTISEAVNRIWTKGAKRQDRHVTLTVERGSSADIEASLEDTERWASSTSGLLFTSTFRQ